MLVRGGAAGVKVFLHISREGQLDRFQERLEREDKHWKFSANDVREREHWDEYQRAYEDALNATSTPWAPWDVVPSDHRWFRNYVVARVLAASLVAMDPRFPAPPEEIKAFAERELGAAR